MAAMLTEIKIHAKAPSTRQVLVQTYSLGGSDVYFNIIGKSIAIDINNCFISKENGSLLCCLEYSRGYLECGNVERQRTLRLKRGSRR